MYGPSPQSLQSCTPHPAHPRPPLGSLPGSLHRGSVKLLDPQHPVAGEVVGVVGLVLVEGVGEVGWSVGPGGSVGPPPIPGRVAIQ